MMAEAGGVSGGRHWSGWRRDEHCSRVGGGGSVGLGKVVHDLRLTAGSGPVLMWSN